jgi:hypothetical protein
MDGQNNASQTYDTARAVQRKQRYLRFFAQRDSAAFRIDLVVVSEIAHTHVRRPHPATIEVDGRGEREARRQRQSDFRPRLSEFLSSEAPGTH